MSIDAVNTDRIQSQYRKETSVPTENKVAETKKQVEAINNKVAQQKVQQKVERQKRESEQEIFLTDIETLSGLMNRKIQFSMDYVENEMIVRIIDKDTKEVIRQLPPEELRKLHKKLQETAEMLGLIVDATA